MNQINKNLMSINHTSLKRSKSDIQWIVIHYVGALGDAKANTDYYKSTNVGASADFWVGFSGDIWQGNDYYNYYSWHCGGGYQSTWTQNDGGKYYGQCTNKNSIGIEMCVRKTNTKTMNATDTDWYFEPKTIEATAELVAKLMKELEIDINHVIMHYHVNRKICAAPFVHDYNAWMNFKAKVMTYYGGVPSDTQPLYRVRKSWADEKSQLFAGTLDGAKKVAGANPGYYVYDEAGKMVFGVTDAVSSPASTAKGTQAKILNGLSEADKIKKMAPLYQEVAKETGMLASVGLAQFALESGYGTTDLAQNANNLHGMKCSLSGNTWSNSTWDGKSKYNKKTAEQDKDGNEYYIYADFRKYPCMEDSIRDRAAYFLGAKNGTKNRYPGIGEMKTAEEQIKAIKAGGYATDINYVSKLMNIVNRFNLTQYDPPIEYYRVATDFKSSKYINQIGAYTNKDNAIEAAKKAGSTYKVYSPDGQVIYSTQTQVKITGTTTVKVKEIYAVRRTIKNVDSQIGLFASLSNAMKMADTYWGYNVYNIETNKTAYKPVLMNWQKVCASAIELGEQMLKDLDAGHQWEYAGSGERTFAKARKKGRYKANCSGGVYWILRNAGVIPDSYSCNWYGTIGGFKWLTPTAEAEARKYFDIIDIHTKTVNQCIKDGTLHPGDIICYQTFSHTNMYLGNNTSFDSGHNNCHGSGNGAKFYRWVSPLTCGGYKIAQIMRIKENVAVPATTTSAQYRVQAGSYLIKDNAHNMMTKVKAKGFDAQIVTANGEYIVQLGIFSSKTNADNLVAKAKDSGIVCLITQI